MGERNSFLVEDADGRVVADIRSADELLGAIDLFPGYVVVERLRLSEKTRGGVVLPNDQAKQQQNLILFRVAITGRPKEVDPGKVRPILFEVGDTVILRPGVAQMLLSQGQEFGVVSDTDVIGKVKLEKKA